MAMQPSNGHEILVELTAAEVINDYDLIMFDPSDKTKCRKCTSTGIPIGIAIPHDDEMMSDKAGGFVKRTGYQIGDRVTAYDSGTLWVKLGDTVTAGQECIPGATAGRAYGRNKPAVAAPTFTDWALGASPTNTQINAAANATIDELDTAFAAALAAINGRKLAFGDYLVGGSAGDVVPMKIR